MFCRNCNAMLADDAKFCSKCGTKVERMVPETVFCTKCGKRSPRNQMFCTNCGNRLDVSEEVAAPVRNTYAAPNSGNSEQVFTSISYAVGEVTGISLKVKQGSLLFREDRIEVYKVDNMGYLLGGALGGMLIGAVEGAKLAANGSWKKPNAVVPYANVIGFRTGKYGANSSVIVNLNDCTSYTFIVGNKQSQLLSILREKCPRCASAGTY